MNLKACFVFITLLVFSFSIKTVFADNIYKKIYAEQCDSLIKANANNPYFVILDVRTHGEWIADHLEGAINQSTGDSDFKQRLDELPKHKIYLIHCKSGGRSAGAFAKMQELKFAEVYEMRGGINAWKSKGYSTTSELAPKLMLVSYTDSIENLNNTDTIKITVTNRANDVLSFSSAEFNDPHEITHNFNSNIALEGAEDYTFLLLHSPGYSANDTTKIFIDSNGGALDFNIVIKSGTLQNIYASKTFEFNMFPNPADNYVNLSYDTHGNIEQLSIYSISGKLVLNKNDIDEQGKLDITNLKNGIYIVRIKIENQLFARKLIIKH